MNKKILNKDQIFPKLIKGMDSVANVVARTLGPGGLPILIERVGEALDGSQLPPKITKDGVSVSNECQSEDEEEDISIQTVKAICKKTVQSCGDGTTSAVVIGRGILRETINKIRTPKILKMLGFKNKYNPQLVKESVELSAKRVLEELKILTKPAKDINTIKAVATLSANGASDIGEIIGKAFKAVGAEGVVTIDEGVGQDLTLQVCNGYQWGRGALCNDRFFNNKDKTQFCAENARILIYDGDLVSYSDLVSALGVLAAEIMQQAEKENKNPASLLPPIVVVANEFSSDTLQWMLVQKDQMGLSLCAVKGNHVTNVRTQYLDDLAIYTNGSRMGNGNRNLRNFELKDLGFVNKIVIDKYTTTIFGGGGEDSDIIARVDQLKAAKQKAESAYDAQIINDRIASLTGGIAKICVGATTDLELKEKYDRIEDALNAARAAIEEGVIVGGGLPLFRIALKLEKSRDVGDQILGKALKDPFLQILSNVGLSLKDVNMKMLLKNDNLVFDARNKKIVDAFSSGILDPMKVTRSALENAVSISALLSTTGGAIVYTRK